MQENRKPHIGRLALIGATLVWGSSFTILKTTLDSVPTLWILALRFTGAAIIMAIVGRKHLRSAISPGCLKYGALLGAALFTAYVLQTYGLMYTTPGKNAFLTSTYCILVPFLWWAFYGRRPDRYNVCAAFICVVGMALVSLGSDLTLGLGDGLTMACGLFYALQIILTSRALEEHSVISLPIIQFGVAAVLCWCTAPVVSAFPQNVPVSAWLSIAYMCVMCTCVCFVLQAIGQKYTSPQSAAILLTLESVFGAALSMIFYHETLTLRVACGFVVILFSVIVSETKLGFLRRDTAAAHTGV